MIPLPLPPKIIKKGKNQAFFEIENLYPGYGVTIGNALRRVLFSSLQGVAVTEAKIKGVSHEFSIISGVLEDVITILLNLKKLRFKIYEGDIQKLSLDVRGEKSVNGSDFKLSPAVELATPDIHIATITDKKTELNIEIQLEKGIGYEQKEQRKTKKEKNSAQDKLEIGVILLDAIFTPVKNVNFHVENMRVGDRTDFDKLTLEIETDGTVTPEEAFFEACDILLKHFNVIFEGRAAKENPLSAVNPVGKEETGADRSDPLKINVEDLKITGRTLNALLKNNIKTVGGILRKSEKSLQELEGMGEKAMSEIKRKLKKLGLEIKSGEE